MKKKMLVISLLVGMFAIGSALADQNDTVYVWFYDPAGSDTVWVTSGSVFYLNVFILTSENAYAGDLHLPLGINDIFFDDIPRDECSLDFFPFHDPDDPYNPDRNWDDASFLEVLEGSPPNPAGFHSRSFAGWADLGGPPNPWLYFPDTPTQCLIFAVNAPIDDTLFFGNTYCSDSDTIPFQDGASLTLGGPAASDTVGVSLHSMAILYPCVYFLPSQLPVIGEFELPWDCGYLDFCENIEVFDADGDSLTVEVNAGTIELVGIDGEPGEPTTYTYEWCFDMEDFCGQNFSDDLIITADDGVTDPVSATFGPLTIIGKITASMEDTIYVWPGLEEWMPVYIDVAGCFCLGAFDFTIEYDASVLEATDVMRGDIIMGGEYFNFTYGLGIVNVSFINDLDNGNPAEDICDIDPYDSIFYLKFLLNPEPEYPVDFTVPVCFHDEEPYYTFNDVIDKDGECIWFSHGCEGIPDTTFEGAMLLDLECGNIKVLSDTNIIIGDLNLNGYPWEIGDLLIAHNAVMFCWPLNLRQRLAGDIDQDGNPLTVTDLLYFYYIMIGIMDPDDLIPPYDFPNNPQSDTLVIESAEASAGEELILPVHLVTIDTLITLQFYVISDIQYITLDSLILNDSIPLEQVTCYGNPHVLALNFQAEPELIYPGTYYLGDLIAHVNPDIQAPVTTYIEFSNAPDSLLYTGLANPTFFEPVTINSEIHITPTGIDTDKNAGLPVSFNIKAHPNPFNSTLKITVSCPIESELVIYDLLGRAVKTFPVNSGENSFTWDATDDNDKSVSTGIYFIRVKGSATSQVKKILFLK